MSLFKEVRPSILGSVSTGIQRFWLNTRGTFEPSHKRKQKYELEKAKKLLEIRELGPDGIAQLEPRFEAGHYWQVIYSMIISKQAGNNAAEVFDIADTPENRFKILKALLSTHLHPGFIENSDADTQKASYKFKNDIESWLGRYLQSFFIENDDDHTQTYSGDASLYRHLYRSGTILMILVAEIQERAKHKNPHAKEVLEQINPELAFCIGVFHDIGRYVTQSSKHDDWNLRLLKELNLKLEIIAAKHHAVELDREIEPDTIWQMLSRLADVFGKLVDDQDKNESRLRTTIPEVISHSFNTQLSRYLTQESAQPDSMWYRKTEADVKQYVEKEEARLRIAEDLLEKMGLNLETLLVTISEALNKRSSSIHDAYRYFRHK